MTTAASRLVGLDAPAAALTERLISLALHGLPQMYWVDSDEFGFTRAATTTGNQLRGRSLRYAAIVALGAYWLPEPAQRKVLGGHSLADFIDLLLRRIPYSTNLGDVALVCWSAAQSAHSGLPEALDRLRQLDLFTRPEYVVEAAWVLSALAAARDQVDVEDHLTRARDRLLNSRHPGSPVFPHETAPGLVRRYRSHIACFADQVYPIQALARLHLSGTDEDALAAATRCAEQMCRLQGRGGQWWWHYDARTGGVVEGYPVYTVHQHAMGPMALLDLTDATGSDYRDAIQRGLLWISAPAELGTDASPLILDDEGLTWRKVYRGDPRKVVRGLHTLTTRARAGLRLPGIDLVYPPTAIDRECRPYEFGWLLFAWLSGGRRPASEPLAPTTPTSA